MPTAERSTWGKSKVGATLLGSLFGLIGALLGMILEPYLGIQYGSTPAAESGHGDVEALIALVLNVVFFLVLQIFLPAIAGGVGGAVLGTLFGVWIAPAKPRG